MCHGMGHLMGSVCMHGTQYLLHHAPYPHPEKRGRTYTQKTEQAEPIHPSVDMRIHSTRVRQNRHTHAQHIYEPAHEHSYDGQDDTEANGQCTVVMLDAGPASRNVRAAPADSPLWTATAAKGVAPDAQTYSGTPMTAASGT